LTFSVIVCAYNEERFLGACLISLLNQSRQPDQIIVVNNASTDRTGEIARGTGVVVIDEPRKGLVVARETARRRGIGSSGWPQFLRETIRQWR
jgi:glycosyltransferase involved in cell wall biosynthesis